MLGRSLYEFWIFGLKQASAAMFGGFLLSLMIITHYYYPLTALHRYDFIFLAAIVFQAGLLLARLETPREAWVIIIFHVVATLMELFKTSDAIGSWTYPEAAIFSIGNVPLFTGFMYSAVGSYLVRVWRIFDFEFTNYPPLWLTCLLAIGIYTNFISHHYIYDFRWFLLAATFALFWNTNVKFTIIKTRRWMPLLLGFFLVSLFIWFAENIGSYVGVWYYPSQREAWQMVSASKLVSWYLLMLVSFVLATLINMTHTKK